MDHKTRQASDSGKRHALNLTALALSLITTFTIISSVVSIAKEPPSAIAGKRSADTAVAEGAPKGKLETQPAPKSGAVVRNDVQRRDGEVL